MICPQAADAHADVTVYRPKSGLVVALRAERLSAARTRVNAGAMMLNLRCAICFCRPAKIALPSLIVNPTVAGENFSIRSNVATSYSVGLPGTTSATSFNVHFIPTAYAAPQLCMLSMVKAGLGRAGKVEVSDLHLNFPSTQISIHMM